MTKCILDDFIDSGGLMCVVSGPSGVGKDTLVDVLMANDPTIRKSVSITTKELKESQETQGVDYIEVTRENFLRMVENDEFLEYAEFGGNLYGTPKQAVYDLLSRGHTVLLVIEVQGAAQIRERLPNTPMIFILPPSMEELKKRLLERKRDSEGSMERRLERAPEEIARAKEYDYVVQNDNVEEAARVLEAIINAEKHRVRKK